MARERDKDLGGAPATGISVLPLSVFIQGWDSDHFDRYLDGTFVGRFSLLLSLRHEGLISFLSIPAFTVLSDFPFPLIMPVGA